MATRTALVLRITGLPYIFDSAVCKLTIGHATKGRTNSKSFKFYKINPY